jgi:hypothetical protein
MSVPSVSSSSSQNVGALLLQQLLAGGSASQDSSGLSGLLGDLMTISPAAQQLTQAPTAVTDAMSDLFTNQTDVQGDLSQLKTYFQQNPQSLASLLSSLQGSTDTYDASGALGSNSSLLSAILNGKGSSSETGALLSALLSSQSMDPLIASLGGSEDGSSSSLSMFG